MGDFYFHDFVPNSAPNWMQPTPVCPPFKSREEYYRQVKPRRLAYLQTLLQENNPQMVVGYGKGYWEDYKALFPEMHFARLGQFEVGKSDGQTVVLTDHFTVRSMNGKLDEVAGILRG